MLPVRLRPCTVWWLDINFPSNYYYSYPMLKKILLVSGVFAFAFAILSVSILTSSAIIYPSVGSVVSQTNLNSEPSKIDYQFPSAGRVLPDNPLWTLKALRDKVWYLVTPSLLKKAELALLFSDKRLVASKKLLENKKPDIAISTLTKGEKYLETAVAQEKLARRGGYDTSAFLFKLATAALKHYEIMESLLPLTPEQGKPIVIKTESYSINTYKAARDALYSKGLPVLNNPFDWD